MPLIVGDIRIQGFPTVWDTLRDSLVMTLHTRAMLSNNVAWLSGVNKRSNPWMTAVGITYQRGCFTCEINIAWLS